jgi:hypothetical protein
MTRDIGILPAPFRSSRNGNSILLKRFFAEAGLLPRFAFEGKGTVQ